MEQQFAELQAKVAKLEKMLITVMTGPLKVQKDMIDAMRPMFEEWQQGTGKFAQAAAPAKRKRKPMNWVDYNAVMSELNDDGENSYREISKRLNIPDATVRKYAKLTPEEVSALQQDHLANEALNNDDGEE
jgi:hypothetical protein